MADINYDINYEDERFQQVEMDKQAAQADIENTYGTMIDNSDKYYEAQINASKEWADKQTELQNAQTDLTINQIEQQKDQATKDYKKEQSGAYVDWKKESGKYGANAEQMAAAGLSNTGYSESSRVAMYNTYQNRVASARDDYNNAIQNYNNGINEAKLQNSSTLAQIHYEAFQTQLSLALQGFQYNNQLIAERTAQKTAVENTYYGRYQDVLNQMNKENALAEEIRQYNESLAEEQRQFNEEMDYKKTLAEIEDAEEDVILEGDDSVNNTLATGTPIGERGDSIVDDQQENQTHPIFDYLGSRDLGPVVNAVIKTDGAEYIPEVKPIPNEEAASESTPTVTPLKKPLVPKENGSYTATTIDEVIESRKNNTANMAPTTSNTTVDSSKGKVLRTDYYYGYYNSDCEEFGVFSNGYQPKGISGHGKVKKTGNTVTFAAKTLSGETRTVTQNLWKTKDGKLWYWDGSKNRYIQVEE